MKLLVAALIATLGLSQSAFADTCRDRFVKLMVDGNGPVPVKIAMTQQMTGMKANSNTFYQQTPDHAMTVPTKGAWVLTYENAMYTSDDKGKNWKKLRDFDSAKNAEAGRKGRQAAATTVSNAVCAHEKHAGVLHDTVEADFETVNGTNKASNHYKYWVNPGTGFIAKATYLVKTANYEYSATQVIEPAPDLALPEPK